MSSSSGRIVPPAELAFAPTPIIVARRSTCFVGGSADTCGCDRRAFASSATVKYCASSPMSPSRFHVFPLREISDSRVTVPATIHCCSAASSRHCFCSPFSSRMSQFRSRSTAVGSSLIAASTRFCFDELGRCRVVESAGALAGGAPTFVVARLRILNMCPQFVHLTVTPPGLSLASSSSYSVWHFSQRTSIDFRRVSREPSTPPRRLHI